jgi:hypothetical protein
MYGNGCPRPAQMKSTPDPCLKGCRINKNQDCNNVANSTDARPTRNEPFPLRCPTNPHPLLFQNAAVILTLSKRSAPKGNGPRVCSFSTSVEIRVPHSDRAPFARSGWARTPLTSNKLRGSLNAERYPLSAASHPPRSTNRTSSIARPKNRLPKARNFTTESVAKN